jgi:hypothetical protein
VVRSSSQDFRAQTVLHWLALPRLWQQLSVLRSRGFVLKVAALWLAWFVAVAFCYYKTNITFLRAESGYYLMVSHASSPPHLDVLRDFVTKSYRHHYIPAAFYSELELSYLFGPHERFWKLRQVAAISLLATCLSLLLYTVARIHALPRLQSMAIAAGASAIFVFQPLMHEFVAWPFLIFQLNAFILYALTLFALAQWIKAPTRKIWIWLAAAFSYLSMHAIGFGLATVVATAAVFAACLLGIYFGKLKEFVPARRTLLAAFVVLLIFTGVHTLCMQLLSVQRPGPSPQHLSPDSAAAYLGYCALAFVDMAHALIWFDPPPSFAQSLISDLWPWGLFFFALAISFLVLRARSCLSRPTPERLTQFSFHCFSIAAFCVFVFLILARRLIEADPNPIQNSLFGARYLVPGNFMLFGSFAVLAVTASRRSPNVAAFMFLILGFIALISGRQFGATTYLQLAPHAVISHDQAWRSLVSLARECRRAGLPVPNVPLAPLTEEFYDFDLKLYQPLLKYSLHLPAKEKIDFEPWQNIRGAELQKYQSVAPSFGKITDMLKLKIPPD